MSLRTHHHAGSLAKQHSEDCRRFRTSAPRPRGTTKLAGDEPYLMVEARDVGWFFGCGPGFNPTRVIICMSLPENDVSLEAALAAATEWAGRRGVSRIWLQTM